MKKFGMFFSKFAKWASCAVGSSVTFILAMLVILMWSITGPIFHFSDTWQLVINTGTTIITFLMVFLIQNTQNRDSAAIQIKLDELIRAMEGAHNALLDIEELSQKDIDAIRNRYENLAKKARDEIRKGNVDTGRYELKD